MRLTVYRYYDDGNCTLGVLNIDGKFESYTLEDEERTVKVWGETRIPEGTYKIGLRTEGGHHARYSNKFPNMHLGMLHVLDVPNFEYILIHIGNTDDDTAGCLLVGEGVRKGAILKSTVAYQKMYIKVARAIQRGEPVTITYKDIEND